MEAIKGTAKAKVAENREYAKKAAKTLNAAPLTSPDMTTAQLSLIEELSLDCVKEVVCPRPARKFTGPSSLPYALVLLALLSGPLPLEQLQLLARVDNGTALMDTLRQLGLEVPCHQVPELDNDGHVRCRTVCMLSTADTRHIHRWIKRGGGGYV